MAVKAAVAKVGGKHGRGGGWQWHRVPPQSVSCESWGSRKSRGFLKGQGGSVKAVQPSSVAPRAPWISLSLATRICQACLYTERGRERERKRERERERERE